MRFILDNPVIAFGILAVSGFMIFAISKLVSEFNLNKALHLKHKSMRLIKVGSTAFKTKLALITSAALAPAVVVIMVFTAGTNPAPVDQIKTTEFLGNITSQKMKIKLNFLDSTLFTKEQHAYVNLCYWAIALND